MSIATPIVNGNLFGGHAVAPVAVPGAGQSSSSSSGPVGASVADVQGTGALTGLHNTPLHVAGVLLVALGVIVAFNLIGFRFAADVGVGK